MRGTIPDFALRAHPGYESNAPYKLQTEGRTGSLPGGPARKTQRSGYATQRLRRRTYLRTILSENRCPVFKIMR
jgi:hypothetical protein